MYPRTYRNGGFLREGFRRLDKATSMTNNEMGIGWDLFDSGLLICSRICFSRFDPPLGQISVQFNTEVRKKLVYRRKSNYSALWMLGMTPHLGFGFRGIDRRITARRGRKSFFATTRLCRNARGPVMRKISRSSRMRSRTGFMEL